MCVNICESTVDIFVCPISFSTSNITYKEKISKCLYEYIQNFYDLYHSVVVILPVIEKNV